MGKWARSTTLGPPVTLVSGPLQANTCIWHAPTTHHRSPRPLSRGFFISLLGDRRRRLYGVSVVDAIGDGYLEMLVQTLDRTRRLLNQGGLRDPASQRCIAALEFEVAVAQLKRRSAQRSTEILLPSGGALRRLASPVRDESRRLRQLSGSTRARSLSLRSSRRAPQA